MDRYLQYDNSIRDAISELKHAKNNRLELIQAISKSVYYKELETLKAESKDKWSWMNKDEYKMKAALFYFNNRRPHLMDDDWSCSKCYNVGNNNQKTYYDIWNMYPRKYGMPDRAFFLKDIWEFVSRSAYPLWLDRVKNQKVTCSLEEYAKILEKTKPTDLLKLLFEVLPERTFVVNVKELYLKDIVIIVDDSRKQEITEY